MTVWTVSHASRKHLERKYGRSLFFPLKIRFLFIYFGQRPKFILSLISREIRVLFSLLGFSNKNDSGVISQNQYFISPLENSPIFLNVYVLKLLKSSELISFYFWDEWAKRLFSNSPTTYPQPAFFLFTKFEIRVSEISIFLVHAKTSCRLQNVIKVKSFILNDHFFLSFMEKINLTNFTVLWKYIIRIWRIIRYP